MDRAVNYGYAHSCVDSGNFLARQAGIGREREIGLIGLSHTVTSVQATREALDLGLERPVYEDALYFAIAYP